MPVKKVGIMGGTFNPIHFGHIEIAKSAYETFNLDEVLFIPNGSSYMKQNVLKVEDRVNMTALAIKDYQYFKLSKIEAERPGNSYSYETIKELKKENPLNKYFFIVGADSLMYMENWKHPELIFNEATVLVSSRNSTKINALNAKINELKVKFNSEIFLLPIKNIDISSSVIRKLVNENKSIDNLTDKKVIEYIKSHNLYR